MTPPRRRYLLALFLLLATPAFAQTATTPPSGCELERSPSSNGNRSPAFIPVLSGKFADPTLESQLVSAYRSLPLRPQVPATRDNLRGTLALARSLSNRCAEALAAYGLGTHFYTSDVAAASDWFRQAEAAFKDAGSASGLAHVHFELAALTNNSKSDPEVRASFTAAADELEQIGDPLDALSAHMQAVNISAPDSGDRFSELVAKAQSLNSPALEARIHQVWGDSLYTHGQYD